MLRDQTQDTCGYLVTVSHFWNPEPEESPESFWSGACAGGRQSRSKKIFKQAVKWFFSAFNSCEMFTNKNINHSLKNPCQQYLEEELWNTIAGVSWMQMLDNAVERGSQCWGLQPGRRNFRNLFPDLTWAGLVGGGGRGEGGWRGGGHVDLRHSFPHLSQSWG
jgi:hypothetical protein